MCVCVFARCPMLDSITLPLCRHICLLIDPVSKCHEVYMCMYSVYIVCVFFFPSNKIPAIADMMRDVLFHSCCTL